MDPLVLIAAIAAALVVLHVVVAAYLHRAATGSDDRSAGAAEHHDRDSVDGQQDRAAEDEPRTPCPACETPNDPSYRFCRQCVADLSNSGASIGGPEPTEQLGS